MWMTNEERLVDEVLRGNHSSFELLLRPYRQGLLTMTYRMTGNYEEAREICQEALIKIYRYLHRFKKEHKFKSWIYTITLTSAYDHLRKRRKYEDIVEKQKNVIPDSSFDPEKRLLEKEIKKKIETCLQDLSPKEKAIFQLRDGEGFSIEETAEILGCSSWSVRTHLCRARQKIRSRFEKIYFQKREVVR